MLNLIAVAAVVANPGAATVKSGVERWRAGDHAAAVAAWLPFAAQGDRDALFNMGQAYKLGRGVTRDQGIARDYYRKAADKGHLPAQANLGIALFQAGDKAEAVRWLKTAADRGEARAQYVYGIALYNGDGTPRNQSAAYGYLLRAREAKLTQAATALQSIEPALTPEARTAGEAVAAALASGAPVSAVPPPRAVVARADVLRTPPMSGPTVARSTVALPPPPTSVATAPQRPAPVAVIAAAPPRPASIDAAPSPVPTTVARADPSPRPPATVAQAAPSPRPPATVAQTAPSPRPPATIVQAPPAAKPPSAIVSVPAPATSASTATAPALAAAKPAVVAQAVAKPVSTKSAPPRALDWRVQLGAFSSQKQADAAWTAVRTTQAAAIGKAKPIFDASGSVVKVQLGPYANRDAARDVCAKLAFAGRACFVTQG